MKNLYILLLIILAASIGSCTKELDQYPISAATTETFFSTQNDFVQGVNAIYADLGGYPERLFNLSETRSDNMYAISDGGVRDWEGINDFWSTLSSNPYIPEAWNSNFNGIMRANIVIDQFNKRGNIVTDKVLRARMKAEAKFLRAFYYFDLVRYFGKVPLIDKPISPDDALNLDRSPVSNVYDLIISDLTYAADSLLATYPAADLGRPTKYSAKGLLALVYMTRSGPTYSVDGPGLAVDGWSQAEILLNDIIGSGNYQFLPTMAEIFRYNNEYNKEVVFDLNFISGQTPILGNHFPAALVPEDWFAANAKPTMGGSDRPISWYLLKKFTASDNRKAITLHGGFTYGTKVDTLSFYVKYLDMTKVPGNINLRNDWPINFIVMRYTDVLLLKAECILHGAPGTQAEVDGIVNQVRTRAGLISISNVTLQQLMNERQLEFAGEGLRWHDLVRSGLAGSTITSWASVEDFRHLIHEFKNGFVVYPIPQAEMDVKVGLYTQNTDYQ